MYIHPLRGGRGLLVVCVVVVVSLLATAHTWNDERLYQLVERTLPLMSSPPFSSSYPERMIGASETNLGVDTHKEEEMRIREMEDMNGGNGGGSESRSEHDWLLSLFASVRECSNPFYYYPRQRICNLHRYHLEGLQQKCIIDIFIQAGYAKPYTRYGENIYSTLFPHTASSFTHPSFPSSVFSSPLSSSGFMDSPSSSFLPDRVEGVRSSIPFLPSSSSSSFGRSSSLPSPLLHFYENEGEEGDAPPFLLPVHVSSSSTCTMISEMTEEEFSKCSSNEKFLWEYPLSCCDHQVYWTDFQVARCRTNSHFYIERREHCVHIMEETRRLNRVCRKDNDVMHKHLQSCAFQNDLVKDIAKDCREEKENVGGRRKEEEKGAEEEGMLRGGGGGRGGGGFVGGLFRGREEMEGGDVKNHMSAFCEKWEEEENTGLSNLYKTDMDMEGVSPYSIANMDDRYDAVLPPSLSTQGEQQGKREGVVEEEEEEEGRRGWGGRGEGGVRVGRIVGGEGGEMERIEWEKPEEMKVQEDEDMEETLEALCGDFAMKEKKNGEGMLGWKRQQTEKEGKNEEKEEREGREDEKKEEKEGKMAELRREGKEEYGEEMRRRVERVDQMTIEEKKRLCDSYEMGKKIEEELCEGKDRDMKGLMKALEEVTSVQRGMYLTHVKGVREIDEQGMVGGV